MPCLRCGGATQERVVRVRRPIVLALFLVGFGLAWGWTGALLHDLVEGGQRSILPVWKAIVPALMIIGATVVLFARRRRAVCSACNSVEPAWLLEPLDKTRSDEILASPARRKVLRALGGVGTGAVATAGGG